MAAGALHADTEKDLGGGFGELFGFGIDVEITDGAVGVEVSGRGEELAGHFIDGPVFADGVGEPVVEAPHAFVAQEAAIDAEEVAPFHGPEIDVFGAIEQFIDQLDSLLGIVGTDKPPDLVRSGKRPDGVEVSAADEFVIVSGRGGCEAHAIPFFGQDLVDEIARLEGGFGERFRGERDADGDGLDPAHVGELDGGAAG